jgi:ketosteroid isomerase-like protein
VQPNNEPQPHDRATTRAVAETFMSFWAVQDVTETVAMLADDAVSMVHLDNVHVSMSGEIVGRDTIAERLYGELAMWHYLKFEWAIANVHGDEARVRIAFHYQHQKTALHYAGSMRMVLTIRDSEIVRVECHHDGPRAAAFLKLISEREAELMRSA